MALADVHSVGEELHLAGNWHNLFIASCQLRGLLVVEAELLNHGPAALSTLKFTPSCSTSVRTPPSHVQDESTCAVSRAHQVYLVQHLARHSCLVVRLRRERAREDEGELLQANNLRLEISHICPDQSLTCVKTPSESQMR